MAFPMTFAVLSAVLRIVAAQEEPVYVEVGQRLVLEVTPQDLSAIPTPIEIIRWKFNNDLVVDLLHPNPMKYYGRFKDHTHLDVSSLALAIEPVSSADGGKFHLETWEGTVRTFDVRVIEAPPTPEINLKPLECDENRCAMQCSVDTQDLGPVTYQWKPDDGVWTDGEGLKNMDWFHKHFFCRLRTRLRFSPDSLPVDNPRFEEINSGLTAGVIVGIVIAVVLVMIAAVAFIKFCCCKQPPGPDPGQSLVVTKREQDLQTVLHGEQDGPATNGLNVEAPAEEKKALLDPPPAEQAHKEQVELHRDSDGPATNGLNVEAPAEEKKALLDPPPAEQAHKEQVELHRDSDGPEPNGPTKEDPTEAVVC
ncbi:hypothetical protein NHX12_015342 [Muraenolepis orangiensis]|uniref:Uncharacterized protein n=1 Tax=Muraenolepis orangiensis TaxID=630683 RepID=A0A9Q0I2X1_9TELE|nr:hypothetical protein NHX12_015342 [Muraenolepis orangiensis]